MADWSKLVREHQGDVLEEGEQVLATLLANPPGSIGNTAGAGQTGGVAGPAGGSAGTGVGNIRATAELGDQYDLATLAGRFPTGFMLISVTNWRLLVFDRGSIQTKLPQTLVAAIPREAIVRATSTRRLLRRDLELEFVDGSVVQLKAGITQPFGEFERILSEN